MNEPNAEGKAQDQTTSKKESPSKVPSKKPKRRRKASKKRAVKDASKRGGPRGPRPFPASTMEQSLRIPTVIKNLNGGNPWPPAEIASALNIGPKTTSFWYLSSSSRDYGFTTGTSQSEQIALDTIGRDLLYATSPEVEREALKNAFFKIEVFKAVYEYYKGGNLPDLKYLQNTLESVFSVPPKYHQDFSRIYTENLRFLDRYGVETEEEGELEGREAPSTHSIVIGEPKSKSSPVAFVIMPFVEKTEKYPKGFFEEVLRNLITPAAIDAGFKVETAKREGSDMIHSTIVNDLLAADLIIADLTEHNPNVLFELGLGMASEKPTALIRAKGTAQIFDVDNLLRVLDYDSNLWKSTIEADLPRLTNHIKGSWDGRGSTMTYMQILKKRE